MGQKHGNLSKSCLQTLKDLANIQLGDIHMRLEELWSEPGSSKGCLRDKDVFIRSFELPTTVGERLFAALDYDHTGTVSCEQFACGLASLLNDSVEERCALVFHALDMRGNVTRDEVIIMATIIQRTLIALVSADGVPAPEGLESLNQSLHKAVEDAFQQYDTSSSGSLTRIQLQSWLEATPEVFDILFPFSVEEKEAKVTSDSIPLSLASSLAFLNTGSDPIVEDPPSSTPSFFVTADALAPHAPASVISPEPMSPGTLQHLATPSDLDNVELNSVTPPGVTPRGSVVSVAPEEEVFYSMIGGVTSDLREEVALDMEGVGREKLGRIETESRTHGEVEDLPSLSPAPSSAGGGTAVNSGNGCTNAVRIDMESLAAVAVAGENVRQQAGGKMEPQDGVMVIKDTHVSHVPSSEFGDISMDAQEKPVEHPPSTDDITGSSVSGMNATGLPHQESQQGSDAVKDEDVCPISSRNGHIGTATGQVVEQLAPAEPLPSPGVFSVGMPGVEGTCVAGAQLGQLGSSHATEGGAYPESYVEPSSAQGVPSPVQVGVLGPTQDGIPSPILGEVPSSTQSKMSIPIQGEMPGPTQGEVPSPIQGGVPSPTQGDVPSPTQGEVPSHVQGGVPSPIQGEVPSPIQGGVPIPIQGEVPIPIQGKVPSPIQGEVPSPIQGEVPSPIQGGISSPEDPLYDQSTSPSLNTEGGKPRPSIVTIPVTPTITSTTSDPAIPTDGSNEGKPQEGEGDRVERRYSYHFRNDTQGSDGNKTHKRVRSMSQPSMLYPEYVADRTKESIVTAWLPNQLVQDVLANRTILSNSPITCPGLVAKTVEGDAITEITKVAFPHVIRKSQLSVEHVSMDGAGLRRLVSAGCLSAALELTARVLSAHGQGFGSAGLPSVHTHKTMQMWSARISLLVHMRRYREAEEELEPFKEMDNPDLYYQYHFHNYPDKCGSMVPFSLRLLHAQVPSYVNNHQLTLNRLCKLQFICGQLLSMVEAGHIPWLSDKLTPENQDVARTIWSDRLLKVRFALANCLVAMQDYELAADVFKSVAVQLPSLKADVYSGIGRIYLQGSNLAKAQEYFTLVEEMATEDQTKQALIKSNEALTYVFQGKWREAAESFQDVIDLQPENMAARNNRALCHIYQDNVKEAISEMEQLIRSSPAALLQPTLLSNLSELYDVRVNSQAKRLSLLSLLAEHAGDAFNISALSTR